MKKIIPIAAVLLVAISFFYQLVFKGLIPIPADDIIGLYHPFRDLYAKDYPRGIPFKNPLITDPVRQQYPWKKLVIDAENNFSLPLWNPYNGAGTPLLANLQSAALYPFNLLFFILPFNNAWSILILLQPLLAGIFLYLYLNNLRLSKYASILGAITFAFSAVSISWLEWGNVMHTALWLPLVLLSVDKIIDKSKNKNLWSLTFVLAIAFSLLAGYLQTFFYVLLVSIAYILLRVLTNRDMRKTYLFIFLIAIVFLVSAVQWLPTLQFILLSARSVDVNWLADGWFVPWKHLIQFIAPDFFGNPATLNYFGVWNYAELVGYVGIVPLILALFALFSRKSKEVLFFGSAFFISLIFTLPTFLAKLPFEFNLPFIATAQPTRLLFVTDFSLSVLAAFGFGQFLKRGEKIYLSILAVGLSFAALWLFVLTDKKILSAENLSVAKHNLFLPSVIFAVSSVLLLVFLIIKNNKLRMILPCLIIAVTIFDLFRFGFKFISFSPANYLFPQTPTLTFLQKNIGNFRIMETDSRILPPNFSAYYKIQSLDDYDPLYLQRYGQLIAASERKKPDISAPFGFNRIITPQNYSSPIADLLGVKYILSLSDINATGFVKVFQEGQTQVYENKNVLPRAFFVKNIVEAASIQEEIDKMFDIDFKNTAVVQNHASSTFNVGEVTLTHYAQDQVKIETENDGEGFLVLSDSFYPTWKATVDGRQTKIYLTDFNFRGIIIPKGKHKIVFSDNLF